VREPTGGWQRRGGVPIFSPIDDAPASRTVTEKPTSTIDSYHAHVYYDADTREKAARLRAVVEDRFDVTMGRWRDFPVGPHPMWSYQIAFGAETFAAIVPWLALNRDWLTVFLHPNTGDALADHRDHAVWMGDQQELKLSALEPAADTGT
jgi:aromatic ring-cleaving dioxygenase